MNELVERLTKKQKVETARPEKTAQALKQCLDRDYVHVMFSETGTELGVQLDREDCSIEGVDFEKGEGTVRISGGLTLNYDKVRCIAEIDIATCEGAGYLVPVSDEEYEVMMGKARH